MKKICRKIQKFFDFRMGWFFINGRKEERYFRDIHSKWSRIETEEGEKY